MKNFTLHHLLGEREGLGKKIGGLLVRLLDTVACERDHFG